jgi:hypothetical protein
MDNNVYAPGQFVPGSPRQNNSSLGGYGGYRITAISVDNGLGDDMRIAGNAFGAWTEPGIVWVMQDENGNNAADDTWYELRGNVEDLGIKVNRRYAITFYKSGDSGILKGGAWEDNLGNYGTCGPGQIYPTGSPDSITFSGTCIVAADDELNGHGRHEFTGYVDVLYTRHDINNAIQADGSAANLTHIDFVKVQTGEHRYTASFGEISTETDAPSRIWEDERSLTGTNNGSGAYTYRVVNNSGYAITVSFKDGPDNITVAASGGDETITWAEPKLYFDYSGGNVSFTVSGNTVTFKSN